MLRTLLLLVLAGLVPQSPELSNSAAVVDPRDQQRYPIVEIAGMQWLGRNLVFNAPGSSCPDGGNDCADGRLYPWTVANTSCPAGWHLATEDEWQRLERHLGMSASDLSIEQERGKARLAPA